MTETHLQIKAQYEAYLEENRKAFENKGVKASRRSCSQGTGRVWQTC